MAISYLLGGASVVLFLLIYHYAYPRPYPGIPYNKRSAKRVLGDLPDLFDRVKTSRDTAKFAFEQCRNLNSPVVQLFLRPFSRPFIYIDDVREAEDIMVTRSKEFDRAPSTIGIFKPFVPHSSIIKLTTPEWRAQRRLWTDIMSTDFLQRVSGPKMYRSAQDLVDLFRSKATLAEGRPFSAAEDFQLATLDAIWGGVLGSDLNGAVNERKGIQKQAGSVQQPVSNDQAAVMPIVEREEMYRAAEYFNASIEKVLISPLPRLHHWLLRQLPAYKRHWAAKGQVVNSLIKNARERFSHLSGGQIDDVDTCAMDLVLRRELSASQKTNAATPTTEEIHDELFMFLIAGHETTATTLSWSSKYLTNNPTEQNKLREALYAVFPDASSSNPPTLEQILNTNIPYLDATLEEVVRLANIVPRLVRVATVDTQVLGYPIPKGAHIVCSSYVAEEPFQIPEGLRSPRSQDSKSNVRSLYDPDGMDGFRPERWLDVNGSFEPKSLPRLAFSAGPRACFGRRMAMQKLRIMLAILVLNFKFEAVPEPLNSPLGRQKALRIPAQCFVRLTPL